MRNLKKLLAVIVAICVLASFTVPAFAAESTFTYGDQAQKLYDLSLFKGLSATEYVPDLGSALTREAGTALLVRLFGVEADALALTDADTILAGYTDVKDVSPWAKNYVAYAVKTKLVEGTTATTLDPKKALTGNTVATIILRKLGYTVAAADFSKAAETLVTKGGLTAEQATALASKDLIRDDAVGMMFGSLSAVDTAGKKIIENLVAAKVVTEEKAIAAGLMTAAPAVPAVSSITGTNLKELSVVFTSEVDKTIAETASNYTVAGVAPVSATLGADKKTVTLVVPDANIAANGGTYAVVVKKAIANTAAVTMAADYSTTVRVVDNVLPDATAIALTGPQTFEITFNEPVKTAGTVKVNSGIYGVTSVTTGTTIVVTLAASQLPDANYTISISGFKDYAGYEMIAEDMTLAYAKATDAITASVTSATQTKVVIAFNRAVTLAGTATTYKNYFYQTYSAWQPTTASSTDGKTWTLEFTNYYVPAGTTNLVIKYTANDAAIADKWGNKLAADITLPVTVTADSTAPTVVLSKTAVTDEATVKVYFSEDMEGATTASNYTVKDSAGTKVTTGIKSVTFDSTDYFATITFNAKLTGGNYTVEIANLTDTSLAKNKLATIAVPFTVTDLTPMVLGAKGVTITAIDGDTETLYVNFNEKVATTGVGSALDKNNYAISVDNGATTAPAIQSIALFGTSGKVVKIVLDNTTGFSTALAASPSKVVLSVGRIADLAGNLPVALSYSYGVTKEIGPAVTAIKMTDYNKVSITVDKRLLSVLPDAFVTTGAGVTGAALATIDSWTNNDDGTATVTGSVNGNFIERLKTVGAYQYITTKTSITLPQIDLIGQYLVSETSQAATSVAAITVADYRAPVVLSVTNSAITFSENLDSTTTVQALYANDLVVVKVASDGTETTLTPGLNYTTRVVNDVLYVDGLTAGTTYKISTKATITYIRDNTNNTLATPYTTVTTVYP